MLIVEQEEIAARLDLRTEDGGWHSQTLAGPDAPLALPEFGLHCSLGRVYDGTPLRHRRTA